MAMNLDYAVSMVNTLHNILTDWSVIEGCQTPVFGARFTFIKRLSDIRKRVLKLMGMQKLHLNIPPSRGRSECFSKQMDFMKIFRYSIVKEQENEPRKTQR
jgi:hypothetical protein